MALDKHNDFAASAAKSGIGGWLVLPAIGLVLAPLGLAALLVLAIISVTADTFKEQGAAHPGIGAYMAVAIVVLAGLLFTRATSRTCSSAGGRRPRGRTSPCLGPACSAASAWEGCGAILGLRRPQIMPDDVLAAAVLLLCLFGIPYFRRSKQVKAAFVSTGSDQEARWFAYGSNVVVALVLAAVVAVAAVWLSGALLQGRVRSNWASGGSTRLSPKTQALLADLPCNVTMTNLYLEESPDVPNSADMRDMRRQVQQLLQNYAAANPSRITVEEIDPQVDIAGRDALLNRLRERYKAESEKPKALIDEFLKIQADASKIMESQSDRLADAADSWTGGPPAAVNALHMLAQRWAQLKQANAIKSAMVQAYVGQEELPDYTAALSQARTILKGLDDNFAAVPDFFAQILAAAKASPPPKEVLAILTGGKATYAPLRTRIDAFNTKAAEVKPLELDRITKELNQDDVILIETPTAVKVVPFGDVWLPNPVPSTGGAPSILQERMFAGEQAVSSALLGVVKETRPAILFVTFAGPATEYRGPYMELGDRLRRANFIVEDWDLARKRQMPQPEHASKVILVFIPPPQMDPRSPMPPATAEQYQPAIDAVKAGPRPSSSASRAA